MYVFRILLLVIALCVTRASVGSANCCDEGGGECSGLNQTGCSHAGGTWSTTKSCIKGWCIANTPTATVTNTPAATNTPANTATPTNTPTANPTQPSVFNRTTLTPANTDRIPPGWVLTSDSGGNTARFQPVAVTTPARALCLKAGGGIGTCTDAVGGSGTCTCE